MKIKDCEIGMKVKYIDDDAFGKMHNLNGKEFKITCIDYGEHECKLNDKYVCSPKHFEPVIEFEEGEKVIYKNRYKSKIFGIADEKSFNDKKYAISYSDKYRGVINKVVTKESLSKLKNEDELEIGDKFVTYNKTEYVILARDYDGYNDCVVYFSKQIKGATTGLVKTLDPSCVKEVIYE